jgi:hypothetical protein
MKCAKYWLHLAGSRTMPHLPIEAIQVKGFKSFFDEIKN